MRVSIGTAAVLGLITYRLAVPPTTAYIMSYTEDDCLANCSFCAQAREHHTDKEMLSRVDWPDYKLDDVLAGLKEPAMNVLERICLQVINYPGFLLDTLNIVNVLNKETRLPVSVDICPLTPEALLKLKDAGAERISIPLDAATPEIFDKVKGRHVNGPYRWGKHLEALNSAVEIFGEGKVGTNIIIGLGETEKEAVKLIQMLHDNRIKPIIFAFTPLKGTRLQHQPQPELESYRKIQVARHLINENLIHVTDMIFDSNDKITNYGQVDLNKALTDGAAFRTTGCPGCNRPFYNERPSGPFYNYPRPLTLKEVRNELSKLNIKIFT